MSKLSDLAIVVDPSLAEDTVLVHPKTLCRLQTMLLDIESRHTASAIPVLPVGEQKRTPTIDDKFKVVRVVLLDLLDNSRFGRPGRTRELEARIREVMG